MTTAELIAVLGGCNLFGRARAKRMTPLELTREGLPPAVLNHLARTLDIRVRRLAKIVSISERTLARRRVAGDRLTKHQSDRVMRAARVFCDAARTLGSIEAARVWLKSPNAQLEHEAPLELLDTDTGAWMVERELNAVR